MIISPPFLPAPLVNEADEAYLDRAMVLGAKGEGAFLISYDLNWHNGAHLTAPLDEHGTPLAVRAISDGTVLYVRQPTPRTADLNHPLNYRGTWTDSGCVVLRHQTDIGSDASGAATTVEFYSVHLHLASVDAAIRKGGAVYRKAVLGTAGQIYGVPNQVHFEILCDAANVQKITGRTEAVYDFSRDGRTDAVFGAMYFVLPPGTRYFASDPSAATAAPAVASTTTEACCVCMRYEKGDAVNQTMTLQGTAIGPPVTEGGAEYDWYGTVTSHYSACQSAGLELLRFGRVLGPDVLRPANAPHWRKIGGAAGEGWANLNAPGVIKFSDADFALRAGGPWLQLDFSAYPDSRFWLAGLFQFIDDYIRNELKLPDVQVNVAHVVARLQTEWDASAVDARWGWLQRDPRTNMNAASYARFKAHMTALGFWKDAGVGTTPMWYFQPKAFILQFRQCGWLSLSELTQLLPRNAATPPSGTVAVPWRKATDSFRPFVDGLNRTLRKYNLLDANRQTQFLAQTYIESALWTTTREFGRGHANSNGTWAAPNMQCYTVFYGRGFMQLTWPSNYDMYGQFRGFAKMSAAQSYADTRLSHTSLHHWGSCTDTPMLWFPRYDPDRVADDPLAACDSAAFYWVSKLTGSSGRSINRYADAPFSPRSVGMCSYLVNGGQYGVGGFGRRERQCHAAFINHYRGDGTTPNTTTSFTAPGNMQVVADLTPQRPTP